MPCEANRTHQQCFEHPRITTAFTTPTSEEESWNYRKRSRTSTSSTSGRRMTLFTLIYISLAVITLFLSPPSAYAEGCSPVFILRDSNGTEEGLLVNNFDGDSSKNEVMVREGASFYMTCELSRFNFLKWTINSKEITPQLQEEWEIDIETAAEADGYIYSKLEVFNASTKFHPGEYRCTSVCHNKDAGANLGVKVTVSVGLNVTIDSKINTTDSSGAIVYRKSVAREKRVELICTAHVPDAHLKWYRHTPGLGPGKEDMDDVCQGPDKELLFHGFKKTPEHCKVHSLEAGGSVSVRKLEIRRVRKEGNVSLSTISDFRKYECKATRSPNQATSVYVELFERVSAIRHFGRGVHSLTVTEGDHLEIFCDVHGIDPKEFGRERAWLRWTKNGQEFPEHTPTSPTLQKLGYVADERGKPFRVGYKLGIAEPEHRGEYTCEVVREGMAASNDQDGENAIAKFTYFVRVKDKLGALWPFLGICGEVVILCTIILIYEKRKSKAELEESDTDGSPDQTNSNSND